MAFTHDIFALQRLIQVADTNSKRQKLQGVQISTVRPCHLTVTDRRSSDEGEPLVASRLRRSRLSTARTVSGPRSRHSLCLLPLSVVSPLQVKKPDVPMRPSAEGCKPGRRRRPGSSRREQDAAFTSRPATVRGASYSACQPGNLISLTLTSATFWCAS